MFGDDCILKDLAGAAPNSCKLRTREEMKSESQPVHPLARVEQKGKAQQVVGYLCWKQA